MDNEEEEKSSVVNDFPHKNLDLISKIKEKINFTLFIAVNVLFVIFIVADIVFHKKIYEYSADVTK